MREKPRFFRGNNITGLSSNPSVRISFSTYVTTPPALHSVIFINERKLPTIVQLFEPAPRVKFIAPDLALAADHREAP